MATSTTGHGHSNRRRRLLVSSAIVFVVSTILLYFTRANSISLGTKQLQDLTTAIMAPGANEDLAQKLGTAPNGILHHESMTAHDFAHLVMHPNALATLAPTYLPSPPSPKRRLIVIGDVHGCKASLDRLLASLEFNTSSTTDHLVFTGDLLNKGPDSRGVVELAMRVGASAVRGNHEDRVLRAWTGTSDMEEDTAAQDKRVAAGLSEEQRRWVAALPVMLRVGPVADAYGGDVVVVHAGLVPGVPLPHQDLQDAMNVRTLLPSSPRDGKDRPMRALESRHGEPWAAVWSAAQLALPDPAARATVVYGHDAKSGLQVRDYAFGLDSACVRGKRLSALVFEPDEKGAVKHRIVSVKCVAGDDTKRE
ncbi:calcineurin-like phosphoesterase [Xylariomycetidae sp. FL0641]|nr:calcineurin-like phosphoesterase [Xylariomycetidae sp. FL0641]